MRRALVTGAAGFVGQWLCRALLQQGWHVTGASLTPPAGASSQNATEAHELHFITADLRVLEVAREVVRVAEAEAIFHLAGLSFVPAPGRDPLEGFSTNVSACVALLAGIREYREQGGTDPRILVVGSAEQYGVHDPEEGALTENSACRPNTWYAGSKSAQEAIALAACRADGLHIICTRSFNQAGPGQSSLFLLPSLVRQVTALRGQTGDGHKRLRLGNTHTVRDFLHVEDAADAYIALLAHGVPGEVYNVSSGTGVTVADLAREVCARAGVEAELENDPALRRAVDVPWLVGDHSKLRAATGWTPRRSRTDIIDDLLNAASH